jgi:hypothetical protein
MDSLDQGQNEQSSNATSRDTLFLLGGVALVVFGAGLILTNPTTRKLLGQVGLPDLTQLSLPDLERYMKMRSM